jgi:Fibronectin type III domain
VVGLGLTVLTACSSSVSVPEPVVVPSFTVGLPANLSVAQCAVVDLPVTFNRRNGHTAAITVQASEKPADTLVTFPGAGSLGIGAVGQVAPAQVAIPRTYTLKIGASDGVQTASATTQLTITAGSCAGNGGGGAGGGNGVIANPTGLTASPTSSSIALSWNPVAGALGYTVERLVSGTYLKLLDVSSSYYTDYGLTPSTSYTYRVRTRTTSGASDGVSVGATTMASTGGGGGGGCCKVCTVGKPCGDSCIAVNKTCTKPGGCACAMASLVVLRSACARGLIPLVALDTQGREYTLQPGSPAWVRLIWASQPAQ